MATGQVLSPGGKNQESERCLCPALLSEAGPLRPPAPCRADWGSGCSARLTPAPGRRLGCLSTHSRSPYPTPRRPPSETVGGCGLSPHGRQVLENLLYSHRPLSNPIRVWSRAGPLAVWVHAPPWAPARDACAPISINPLFPASRLSRCEKCWPHSALATSVRGDSSAPGWPQFPRPSQRSTPSSSDNELRVFRASRNQFWDSHPLFKNV